jgi:hypothetical protein
MRITGVSTKTNINYFGDIEKGKQLNSAIDVEGDDPNGFAFNEKITIEVAEDFIAERVPSEQIFGAENYLIFHDAPLEIIMKPFYAQIEASISVKYRASNESQAIQWRNMVKARISERRNLNMHNVTYSYGVPDEMLYILQELHRLRENVAGYGEDFETYFANHRAPHMTMLTNLNGTAKMWAVPETQTRVQGWFDWDLPEKADKDGDGEARIISFTYKFNYARPDGIAMVYPIVVHNQLIDEKLRDIPLEDHNDLQQSMAYNTHVLENFAGGKLGEQVLTDFGYAIPTFDEFAPKVVPISSRRVVTILFTVDKDNPRLFLNLGQLGQKQFTPEILEYMRSERNYLAKPFLSALNLSLYRNGNLINGEAPPITVDQNLNVLGVVDTNLRVQHHLRVGLLTDLHMLKGDAIHRLQEHGKAAIQILLAIDPTLAARGMLPALIGDNFVSKTGLLMAIGAIRPAKSMASYLVHFNTVQTLFVETNKERI